MYKRILRKRILRGLVISLALVAVIPVTNAAAKPVSAVAKVHQVQSNGSYIRALLLKEAMHKQYGLGRLAPTSSEISTGLGQTETFGVTGPERRAMILRGEGLNKKYGLGRFAAQPTNSGDFEWGSTGLGVGIAALLIAGTAGALVVRSRQHGSLAH